MTLSPRARVVLLVAGIVIATVALYYPVSSHPFLNYDDDIYVVTQSSGAGWLDLGDRKVGLHGVVCVELASADLALSRAGLPDVHLDAGRHHETNLLLHVINVMLLFWVLWRATGYTGRSAMVAALFALHPMNVETVAWIAERKNLLSMMFLLLALGAYGWYTRRPRAPRYLVVVGCLPCGLMAKPQVITLPFVLLLWDYWPLQRIVMSCAAAGASGNIDQTASAIDPPLKAATLMACAGKASLAGAFRGQRANHGSRAI